MSEHQYEKLAGHVGVYIDQPRIEQPTQRLSNLSLGWRMCGQASAQLRLDSVNQAGLSIQTNAINDVAIHCD